MTFSLDRINTFLVVGGMALALGNGGLCRAQSLLAINNPASNGAALEGFAAAAMFQANDNVAMRDYGGQWRGPYTAVPGDNVGLVSARAETGVQWQGYRLAVVRRGEALVKARPDTTDLVHQYQSQGGYNTGRAYALDLSLRGFEAEGIGISKGWQTDWGTQWKMRSGVGLYYLRGIQLKLESVTGQVFAVDAKDVNVAATSNSSSSALDTTNFSEFNAPYGRQVPFKGDGYSADAGLVLQNTSNGLRIEVALADLAGQLDWKNVPTNVTNYNTASKYFDANGYVQFDPTITRTSTYQNVTQTLPLKAYLSIAYPLRTWEIEGAANYTQGIWMPQLGARRQLSAEWAMHADYDFRFNTIGVGIEHARFQLTMRTNSLDWAQAKGYGIAARIQFPL